MQSTNIWKKGRGKLGIFQPLLGNWISESDSPRGKINCRRSFHLTLNGKYISVSAHWKGGDFEYEESAMIGMENEQITFWSFTSDGKNSKGKLSSAQEIHPDAICFEAQMPAGIARMIYWPGDSGTFHWAVESKTQKGWNRFTEHHYKRI